jgi:mevalonate kinase
MNAFAASAPGKVILLGEHAVNREQPALAAAIDRRVWCRVVQRADDEFVFTGADGQERVSREALRDAKANVDRLRDSAALDELRAVTANDFFAPTRYVLAHVAEQYDLPPLEISWRSDLPIGAGLGSGAAASTSMAFAAIRAAGAVPTPADVAFLAWQGDVIAHGGVASGLDSGASALGGMTRYTLANGPQPATGRPIALVVADTGVVARTADVNTRVRRGLETHPGRMRLFTLIGLLVDEAGEAVAGGDLDRLGRLMSLGQLVLEKIGVSCSEIDQLVEAALGAGALGAKLSGSGGGGIVIAVPPPGGAERVASAMADAGGAPMIVTIGAEGVRSETTDLVAA